MRPLSRSRIASGMEVPPREGYTTTYTRPKVSYDSWDGCALYSCVLWVTPGLGQRESRRNGVNVTEWSMAPFSLIEPDK